MARRLKKKPTNPANETIKTNAEPHLPQGSITRNKQNPKAK